MGCSLSSQKHATDSSHGVPQISPEKSDSSKRRLKLGLGYEDPALLAQETAFTENEVESLYDLFKKLSSSLIDDGCIHKEEFQLALFRTRGRENFFANRVFDIFDINKNGVIGFGEFVRSLSVFHPNAPIDDKIEFSFRFYDLRGTGSIEREEVKEMLLTVFEESEMQLTDDVIESILDETFSNGIQKIAREEWKDHVKKSPMLMQHMTLPYLQDISTEFPSFSF